MIKHTVFIYTWPFLAAVGTFLFPMLFFALLAGDVAELSPQTFRNILDAYAAALWLPLGKLYFCLAFPALFWSFVRWFKKPCRNTLLWSMFTAWILCGYPGLCPIFIFSFTGFHGS